MYPQDTTLSPVTGTNPIWMDLNIIIAIATAAAAIGAFIGNWLSHRQIRHSRATQERHDLALQVSKEVEAKIGAVLLSLRSLEDEARSRLTSLISTLDARQASLTATVEERQGLLMQLVDRSAEQAAAVEQILQRASLLTPLVQAAELMPMHLLSEAIKASEPAVKVGYLLRILEHTDSDARVLELAGDEARRLENQPLATRLYKRSIDTDPESVTAQAEYLALMAERPAERNSARDQIIALARANPNEGTVVSALVNVLIRSHRFEELLAVATSLLDSSNEKALLWRNIAVARQRLGRPAAEINEAYEHALRLGDDGDYVNAARPYGRYLLDTGQLEQAKEIILRAIYLAAGHAELHLLLGELERKLGNHHLALKCFKIAEDLGDHSDKIIARRKMLDVVILGELGLLPGLRGSPTIGEVLVASEASPNTPLQPTSTA